VAHGTQGVYPDFLSPKIHHFKILLFHNIFDFSSFAFFKNPKRSKKNFGKKGKLIFTFFLLAGRISI
jgi:hypothetical protein